MTRQQSSEGRSSSAIKALKDDAPAEQREPIELSMQDSEGWRASRAARADRAQQAGHWRM